VHLGTDAGFVAQDKPHAAFCVSDLDALVAKLTAAGHEIEWEGIIPGRKRLYTHDPFGNRIELIQDGDGFSQR
jgi:catechol 2,3-dioxygenase-like lactoylglutathione lyase family enzyme